MEAIVIPNFDDEEEELSLPTFGKTAFGSSSSANSTPELEPYGQYRQQPSHEYPSRLNGTPSRPGLNKVAHSFNVGPGLGPGGMEERPKLGKFSNGSSSSLVTPGTSISSSTGFLANRKGSFASLKNAFKGNAGPAPPVPPLKNPFSSSDSPASPTATSFRMGGRAVKGSAPPSHPQHWGGKPSIATTAHSSHRSHGGRSAASYGSSSYRADEPPVPSLPPIPMRGTPSRMGRLGSDVSTMARRQGSISEGYEGTTPSDEALRVIFSNFRDAANQKITRICARPLNTQPSLPAYLEQGVDPLFDGTITSLAQCGKRHARRIADMLNSWCRGHCEGIGASEVRAHLNQSVGMQMRVEDAATILSGRKTSAAKYTLNRAIIELVKQTPREGMGEELGMALESNAFNAYCSEKLEQHSQFPHRRAVSQLQIELLGHLSATRFLTVSDRFETELRRLASPAPTRETEARVEHLLKGMRRLKLRVYPEEELEMSSEFLQGLAGHFANAQGQNLRCAYAETLVYLLHPVIETATAEVNHPLWSKAVAVILQRALTMLAKPKYWSIGFPLLVVTLGVSPREVFMQHWSTCIEHVQTRFKDRATRPLAMGAFVRLLWIYLNRCTESATSMRKRLDTLLHSFLSPVNFSPADLPLEPYVAILHFVMVRYPDYGEDFVTEFLSQSSTSRGAETAPMALPSPERATAVIRASLGALRALELGKAASFPAEPDFTCFDLGDFETCGEALSFDASTNTEITDFLKKLRPIMVNLLLTCDRQVGPLLLSSDTVNISVHASSTAMDSTEHRTVKHGDVHVTYPARHQTLFHLFRVIFDSLPRCLPEQLSFAQIANILSRGTFCADPDVCLAAGDAMRRVAQDPSRCLFLVNTYREFVFETRHIFKDTFVGARALDSQFERILTLWTDLLELLVNHERVRLAQAQAGDEAEEQKALPITTNLLDKLDAAAIGLLCSNNVAFRRLATRIMGAARDLEGESRRPSAAFRYSRLSPDKSALTRVIQIFEGPADDADIAQLRALPWASASDRARIDVHAATKDKLLSRIAESDQPKDGLLWLAVLPCFVGKVQDLLRGPAAELRSIISSTVIRLQGHIMTIGSAAASRATQGMRSNPLSTRTSTDTAALADYWRAYLCILCVTMPDPSQNPTSPHLRGTKEAMIITPDTIGTPALFHYLSNQLTWEDPRFRDAAVYALGSITHTLLRPLSENLTTMVRRLADANKPNGRRNTTQAPIWTALAHVYRLISPMILDSKSSSAQANLPSMISFVKLTYNLLADHAVKEDFDLQSLRRWFCIVVENLSDSLAKLEGSERFFADEQRGAIFKLCYEWCQVGRRPDVARARESHTLQVAADAYRGERDRAAYLDDLQAKTKLLSAAAAEAMAGLCQGKLISAEEATPAQQASDHLVEPLTVLRWIRGMFTSSSSTNHATGRKALFALLKSNWTCARLLDEVLHQSFGEGEQFALDASFFGVVADLLADGHIPLPPEQVACLALSKLGHPGLDIRQRAFQLAISLIRDLPAERLQLARALPGIGSSSANVYRHAQRDIATTLATVFADKAGSFLSECTTRLSQLDAPRRQATLSVLSPWVGMLDLGSDSLAQAQVLSNLMYLAIRFSTDHIDDIRDMFIAFAQSSDAANVTPFVKFLFEQGGQRKSPEFVIHAQRVMACLAQSPAAVTLFDEIVAFVEPDAMAAVAEDRDRDSDRDPSASSVSLDALLAAPSNRSQTFSNGQLALLFAGELLPHRLGDSETVKRLPTLLHAALINCDHSSTPIREACQSVLFQVLRTWISDLSNLSSAADPSAVWTTAELKLTALAQTRDLFWKADDNGGPQSAFLAPTQMTTLVMKVLGILLPLQSQIRQQWGELALTWATSCPIRHLACRSFQAFRILSPKVSAGMMSGTLARLSSTMASPSDEIQSFNQEILRTFASIVQAIPASEIHHFPQIFWCAMACLTTPYESEFAEAIELLSHVLDKTNLSDPTVITHLMSFRPSDWVGPDPYLQSLLLVGLRSSKTAMLTFDLIRRLASAPHADVIDSPDDRLIHSFIAALPWMLHSTDLGEPNEELAGMALDLAGIAETEGSPNLARLLTSFAHVRFRSKDDFVRQASSLIRDYMPTHALDIVTLLLGFVLNTEDWMQEKSMQVLKIILAFPEARGPLSTHGEALLLPLLKLVTTKHAAQALDVLDTAAVHMFADNGTPQGDDIFGPITAETGWSVPNINEISGITRENLTAVFNTCAVETRAASAHFSVVQFADIRQFAANPSFPSFNSASELALDRHTNTNGEEGLGSLDDQSLGDLAGQLHELTQFFDDDAASSSDAAAVGAARDFVHGHDRMPSETWSETKRIRAILARGKQASISSPIKEHHHFALNGNGDQQQHRPHSPAQHSRHAHNLSETSSTGFTSDAHPHHQHQRGGYVAGASSSSLSLAHMASYSAGSAAGRPNNNHQPSHSIASIASDADGGQFGLDTDEPTPSRPTHGHGQGHGSGGGSGHTNGGTGSGSGTGSAGPVSMRSLTSNWSLRAQSQSQPGPNAQGHESSSSIDRERERIITLGLLNGESERTPSPRDT